MNRTHRDLLYPKTMEYPIIGALSENNNSPRANAYWPRDNSKSQQIYDFQPNVERQYVQTPEYKAMMIMIIDY